MKKQNIKPKYLIGLVLTILTWVVYGQAINNVEVANADRAGNVSFVELHKDGLGLGVFSPDAKTLATKGSDGQIILWDVASGQVSATLTRQSISTVNDIVFSADGNILATVCDSSIQLWDALSGEVRLILPESAAVTKLVFSSDGKSLAAVDQNADIMIWDSQSGATTQVLDGHQSGFIALAFSPDSKLLATVDKDAQIKLWDGATGMERAGLSGLGEGGSAVSDLLFSPDGKTLAVVSQDASIKLWDLQSGVTTQIITGHLNGINALAFSPDNKTLVTGGQDALIKLWDKATGQEFETLSGEKGVAITDLVFSQDGKQLASVGESNSILLWDLPKKQSKRLKANNDWVTKAIFSPSLKALISVSKTGQVVVWDLKTVEERLAFQVPLLNTAVTSAQIASSQQGFPAANATTNTSMTAGVAQVSGLANGNGQSSPRLDVSQGTKSGGNKKRGHHNWKGVTALAISPDGAFYGGATKDGSVRLWASSGKERFATSEHHGAAVTGITFSADGKHLISAGRDTEVQIMDAVSGKKGQTLLAHEHPIRAVAASPDGKFLASAGEETRVMLWDARTGKLDKILTGHSDFVNAVSFSADGAHLASAGADGRILVWDVNTGQLVQTLEGHSDEVNALAFSRDGTFLASGGADSQAILWDAATGQKIQSFAGHQSPIRAVAFSPNGQKLVSAGEDTKVLMWDTATRKLDRQMVGSTNVMSALVFGPSGNLIAGGEDGEIKEWDVENDQIRQVIKLPVAPQSNNSEEILKPPFGDVNQTASNSIGHDAYSVSKQSTKLELSQVLGRLIDWLIPAAEAAIPNPPGGPILIVTSTCPTCGIFNKYYAEILRAEGLNEFATADISTVTAASLASYDVVILASTPLTSTQVSDLTAWVNNGGNLIAIKPDPKLASLLGLTAAGTTLSNAYLLVDTLQAPGNGIVNQPIQFHGAADRYTTSGATNLATLYSNVSTATTNPALTLRSVGVNGGQASAFTYDLATSIVYTRQGNPVWQAQERDGLSPIRSDDMYYGNATGDPQPDWVDLLTEVAVPQADEQQHLLANLITQMNIDKKPLPRFWYFPRGEKAVVIMTGDDHGNGGTGPRFDQFISLSPAGCNVANWECIRGTSYIYVEPAFLSDAQAAAYATAGFEVGLHINTNCANYTPASLDIFYNQQIANFHSNYPSIPLPITERHHCIAWSDWTTGALTEFNHGIRLDTSYYFWPPSWVNDRPGNFTGSAMPMRFADLSGNLIDVYQAVSHMTDESGQTYPFTINTLLDRAVGATGYYGAYTINAHTDLPTELPATETVNSAIAHGVPVISSAQMLTWLDGRNGSSFSALAWNGSNLTFSVATALGANGLQAMLPINSVTGVLLALSGPNGPVGFWVETIKGVQYAFFDVTAGAYSATYGVDATPPTVTATSPANNATGVIQQPAVTATFSESVNSATITAANFQLQAGNSPPVSATVSYDASTRTAKLIPNTLLAVSTTYTAKLSAVIKDVAGNPLSPYSWTFTTQTQQLCSSLPCSAWNGSTTPGTSSVNDSSSVELGVKFNSDLAGVITGIRFYNANPGSYVVNLWSGTGGNLGQKLATATVTDNVSGWHQANFLAPVAITANTVYVASYHAPSGHYAGDNLFFATAGVDTLPIHLLKDGVSGGNGVYAYSTSSIFPTNTYQSSNYWVDVVFSSNTGPDTIAPTIISTLPVGAALGVNPLNPVKATFSESVDVTTINNSTFELRDPANTLITATVTYDAGTNTAILTPTVTLAANTSYTAKLVSGPSGVKDLAGNALAANYIWSFTTGVDPCAAGGNPIVCENGKLGNAAIEWDIVGAGDSSIQGFATDISVNRGSSVAFKVNSAAAYQIDIYRMGYYDGLGARKIDTIQSTATIPKLQPNCLTDATGLFDCGNWTVSASWNVPATAASGIYFAKLKRTDTGGASHIVFVVRDDASTAKMVFQTSDTTWQAYNDYGGNSLYSGTGPGTGGSSDGRAYKVSYNRPFNTRAVANGQDWVFNAEYPMVRWLEANGYDVSYLTGVDTDRLGSLIKNHKVFISVGHDEYWSAAQRANIETARDVGGVHIAFFSGNEVYWKMRWETSIDGTNTANRTLVCYKETHNFPNNRDPADASPTWTWTGTWRDPRNTPPADGGRPENALLGPIFMVNDGATTSITVPQADGKMRFWRNTSIANLATGATATLPFGTLGYEWDVDLDNGFRPAGLVRNSTTIVNNAPVLTDYGSTFGSGTANHALTLYRSTSGAIVFGAGTVQWSWGLDGNHDRGNTAPDVNMQQATVNLFADMGSQPATLQSGLQLATASGDKTPPTSTILSPTTGSTLPLATLVTITGTAVDAGGGQVGGIEISLDGGLTWHAATGRGNWSYAWTTPTSAGQFIIKTRSVDDSLNLEVPGTGVTLNVGPDTTAPTAPGGLLATATSGTQISLSWTASSDAVGVTGYLVERCQGVGCANFLQIATPTVNNFLDSGLVGATTYQYRVRATDAAGNLSGYSGVATQTTQPVPIAVADRFLFVANSSRTVNYAGVLGLGVLANDTDPTNLQLTASAVGTLPAGVALASTGVVTVNLSRATTFRYRASNGTFLSQPTTGAVVTLSIDSVPTAAVDNCTYVRAGSGSIRSGAACVMTGPQTFTMNLKANDSDPNVTTNIPSDGIGKTVTGAIINSTGVGVSVSANAACGQAAIANGSSLATITNNCNGSLAVNVNTAATASPITFAYRAIDDLGAQSNSRTNTVTLQ